MFLSGLVTATVPREQRIMVSGGLLLVSRLEIPVTS